MTIRFRIEEKDLNDLRKRALRHNALPEHVKLVSVVSSVLLVGMSAYNYFQMEHSSFVDLFTKTIAPLLVGIFAPIFFFSFIRKKNLTQQRILAHPFNSYLTGIGDREVEFGQEKIIAKSSTNEMQLLWSDLLPVVNEKDYYYLSTRSAGLYIPKRDLLKDEVEALNKLIYTNPARKDHLREF